MKIYTKVVFNMTTLEEVSSDSFEYFGELALLGGGGPSGEVDFPDYMEKIHVNWLTEGTTSNPVPAIGQDLETTMITALNFGGNPWTDEIAFNPDTAITEMKTEHAAAEAVVDGITDVTTVEGYYDAVKTKIDALAISEADINTEVTAYRDRQAPDFRQQVAQFAGGMQDINAVNGSQFIIGLALMSISHGDRVTDFEKSLRIQIKRDKQYLINDGIKYMLQALALKIQGGLSIATLQADINRLEIVAKGEEDGEQLRIDTQDALWDLQVYQYGGNFLAAISGAAHPVPSNSKAASALGGALGGASAGAALGSVVPGIGTAVGAGIGAAVGFIAGLF